MKKMLFVLIYTILFSGTYSFATTSSFEEGVQKNLPKKEESGVVEGKDGYFFLFGELQHLARGRFWGQSKKQQGVDPFNAIIAYNKALADQGITLYLMPIPPKALVYYDKLNANAILNNENMAEKAALYKEFYQDLKNSGVQIIDILPQLLQKKNEKQLYCKTDSHFSGEGLLLFAKAVAEIIKKEEWYENIPKVDFQTQEEKITITGDLLHMIKRDEPKETLQLHIISHNGRSLKINKESPILLIGDSHTLVYNAGDDLFAKGAGLFDHISAHLASPIDLIGVRGSGVTAARISLFQQARKNPEWLKRKKVVIWCFTARDFTLAKWKEIPVVK